MSPTLVTLVLLVAAVIVGWLLGKTVQISRRDDLRNELIQARLELDDLRAPRAWEPEPEPEEVPA